MSDTELGELQELLDKLRSELKYRYSLTFGSFGELITIGIYDANGDLFKQETHVNIKECLNKLKQL